MLWVLMSTPKQQPQLSNDLQTALSPWTPHSGPLLLSGIDHIQLLVSVRFLGTSPPPPAGKNTRAQVSFSFLLQLPLLSSTFVLLPAQSCFIPKKYCKQNSLFYPGNMTTVPNQETPKYTFKILFVCSRFLDYDSQVSWAKKRIKRSARPHHFSDKEM